MLLHASDGIRLSTFATIDLVHEDDMREAAPQWDSRVGLARVALARLRETHPHHTGFRFARLAQETDLKRLARLELTRRAILDGVVSVRAHAEGRNKVLTQGITALLTSLKDGTPYRMTHVDAGSDGSAVVESAVNVRTHIDASAGQARLSITEKLINAKTLKCSVHIANSEYVAADLREVALCDAATGGTPYNVVIFTTPLLAKANTDVGIMNIEHTVNN